MTRRVGVNLAWLVPGVVGGSEEATLGALRAVDGPAASAGLEVVLFGIGRLTDAHPDLADRFEFHRVDVDGGSKVRRVLAEMVELPRLVTRVGVSLVHHAGGVVPFGQRGPCTLAIHDTQPLDLPANFSAVKRRYLGLMIPRSVRRAEVVTAPSEFVRRRLVDDVGADPSKVVVVPWSVPTAAPVAAARERNVRARFGITRPFVLYPAIAYAHKNHAVLLEAVARLGGDGSVPDLVLTGAPGPCDEAVARRAAAPDLVGRVHVLGRIGRPDLDALMSAAAVVAVPSRYEGFGLPALEALAAGRPTVVANAGSLPEVVGDAAIVAGPDDVDAWVAALRSAIDDPAERARLVAAGPPVAASWSPQRTATRLIEVWTTALDADLDVGRRPPRTVRKST